MLSRFRFYECDTLPIMEEGFVMIGKEKLDRFRVHAYKEVNGIYTIRYTKDSASNEPNPAFSYW